LTNQEKDTEIPTNQEAGLLADATAYASALPWVCCWPPADVGPNKTFTVQEILEINKETNLRIKVNNEPGEKQLLHPG
jgi:hypothetical protein